MTPERLRPVHVNESPVPNIGAKGWADLPPWGKVVIVAGLTFGVGTGAGIAGLAKVLGIQTAQMAATDKAELQGKIEGLAKGQAAALEVTAQRHGALMNEVEQIQSALSLTRVELQRLTRMKRPRSNTGTGDAP